MNEEQIRTDIEETLAIEPSPQFLARVRRQLETESRSTLRLRWKVLAAGLGTGAVLLGVTFIDPLTPEVTTPAAKIIRPAAPEGEEQTQYLQAPQLPPQAGTRPVAMRSPQPEVIIDPRETAALRRFLDDVQERRIDPDGLGELFEAVEHASRITGIVPAAIAGFEPIVVKPLSVTASDEGGRL